MSIFCNILVSLWAFICGIVFTFRLPFQRMIPLSLMGQVTRKLLKNAVSRFGLIYHLFEFCLAPNQFVSQLHGFIFR